MPDSAAITRALRAGGPATLDALAARLGGLSRDDLAWALQDAMARGLVTSSAEADCGADGVCSTAPPTVFRLTDAG
jgi:hypothetical protein